MPGAEAVLARMVPGRRCSAVRAALNELLETGVLQNLGDRRRPRFFWVEKEPIEGVFKEPIEGVFKEPIEGVN